MGKRQQHLLDMIFRHQLYVEGVKQSFADDYQTMLQELFAAIMLIISQIPLPTMDAMTRKELNSLMRQIKLLSDEYYTGYSDQLIELLQEFVGVDIEVMDAVVTAATDESPDLPDIDTLWSSITNDPIPANGALVLPFITSFGAVKTSNILHLIRQGYANGWSFSELTLQLTTKFNKLFASQNIAMVGVLTQHATASVQDAVEKSLFTKDIWISVLDSHTTEICRARDGDVYDHGSGPFPPAHYGCRSNRVPLFDGEDSVDEPISFVSWLETQPESVTKDVSHSDGKNIYISSLTLDQFREKIATIIQ